jgi:putative acetyltransferase
VPQIRPYQPQDRAAVALVFYRAVREGSVDYYTEEERAAWAPSPNPHPTKPDKYLTQWCFVAEDQGRMTGFMSMDDTGYLDMAFVIPEAMGTGTAGALYDRLIAHATERGLRHFTVHATALSRRFLEKRGWQYDGILTVDEEGQRYDVNLLSLDLP